LFSKPQINSGYYNGVFFFINTFSKLGLESKINPKRAPVSSLKVNPLNIKNKPIALKIKF